MNIDREAILIQSGATYWPSLKRGLTAPADPTHPTYPTQDIKRLKTEDYAEKMNLLLQPAIEADIRNHHK